MEGDGFWIMGTAAEALGAKKLVYLIPNEQWSLADADIAASMPTMGMTQGAIASGKRGVIFVYGFIGDSTWSWTRGAVYASAIAGELTQSMPDMSDSVVQEIGYASSDTMIFFNPKIGRGTTSPTYTRYVHLNTAHFKIPAAGAPAVNVQDNTVMLGFNQNDSESIFMSWAVPTDYAGGDLSMTIHWTNDGGVDDNGKNVRWEINYQTVVSPGGSIAGDHANSPKLLNDTYTSATGHLEHTTGTATIAAADFALAHHVHIRLTALVAAATQMTGDSQFLEMELEYTAYSDLG